MDLPVGRPVNPDILAILSEIPFMRLPRATDRSARDPLWKPRLP